MPISSIPSAPLSIDSLALGSPASAVCSPSLPGGWLAPGGGPELDGGWPELEGGWLELDGGWLELDEGELELGEEGGGVELAVLGDDGGVGGAGGVLALGQPLNRATSPNTDVTRVNGWLTDFLAYSVSIAFRYGLRCHRFPVHHLWAIDHALYGAQ